MKSTKKREIGVGDNLYGIPINDIVTPIELEEIKSTSRKTASRKRKRSKKRSHTFKLSEINIPQIKLTREATYIVSGVIVFLFLLLIFKYPITNLTIIIGLMKSKRKPLHLYCFLQKYHYHVL